ncbi:MAG: hypothetical protein IJ307_05920 [Bacteroidales bacterium]|nr:hypothetical protein [Bacteroidales bacterium]
MCKKDLCEQIIALVADVTDISAVEIMSSNKRPDVVDARYLAIFIMLQKGVKIYRVAEFMTMTERNVYHVQERFDDRKDYGDPMLENYYNSVLKALK